MTAQFSNILIIGHKNIGDIFHNMAILRPVHLAFPKARISFLTSPIGKILLDRNPYLSEILVFFKKKEKFSMLKERIRLIRLLRKKKFNLIVNLKKGSYFAHFLGAPVWSIPSYYKAAGLKIHVIDIYLNAIRQHGVSADPKDLDTRIVITPSEKQLVENILIENGYASHKKLVILAPFSNWHAKEWNLENFAILSKKLTEDHRLQVVFVGGENDCEKMTKIGGYKKYFIDLVGKISLRQLAALYEKTVFAIGGDSGPFHLATNMRVPAIGIFAPTPHERYGPYFNRELTVSCEEDLGCNPCFAGKKLMACGIYNRTTPCMETISVDRVYQKALILIKLYSGTNPSFIPFSTDR